MDHSDTIPAPSEIAKVAMYLSMVVRNHLEDFHVKHLSDKQMKELNPLIRNSIFTALYALEWSHCLPQCQLYVDFHRRTIPSYWEMPELTDDFLNSVDDN